MTILVLFTIIMGITICTTVSTFIYTFFVVYGGYNGQVLIALSIASLVLWLICVIYEFNLAKWERKEK